MSLTAEAVQKYNRGAEQACVVRVVLFAGEAFVSKSTICVTEDYFRFLTCELHDGCLVCNEIKVPRKCLFFSRSSFGGEHFSSKMQQNTVSSSKTTVGAALTLGDKHWVEV